MDSTTTTRSKAAFLPTHLEMAQHVMDHAVANYEHKTHAWDMIVETKTVEEMADELATEAPKVKSLGGAWKYFAAQARVYGEHRSEIVNA